MAGGKVVGLKQSEFGIAVSSLRAATEGLTPSISDVGEVVCQSDTMRQYRVALSELESLLELYKALLEKDRGGLLAVRSAVEQLDQRLAQGFAVSGGR